MNVQAHSIYLVSIFLPKIGTGQIIQRQTLTGF